MDNSVAPKNGSKHNLWKVGENGSSHKNSLRDGCSVSPTQVDRVYYTTDILFVQFCQRCYSYRSHTSLSRTDPELGKEDRSTFVMICSL